MLVSRWSGENWKQAVWVHTRDLTLVSSLISRMSFCPPPSRILCLSRLTSSSSSFRGGSFAFTGLTRNIFLKKRNQTYQLLSKAKFMSLKAVLSSPLAAIARVYGAGSWGCSQQENPLNCVSTAQRSHPGHGPPCPSHPVTPRCRDKNSPGPDEEPVLDQDSNEEENHPFHGHGKKVSSYQVPRERRHKAILPCETQCGHLVRGEISESRMALLPVSEADSLWVFLE